MKQVLLLSILLSANTAYGDDAPRARDLGIPFDGTPGQLNAITDVAGVTVGHVTLIEDLTDDKAVRTGVTAILPRGERTADELAFAGWFSLNGNGEMTGTTWLDESGFLEGPVMITNTHSVGAVHEGVIRWRVAKGNADHTEYFWSLPVVAETWDGTLNIGTSSRVTDVNGDSYTVGVLVQANFGHWQLLRVAGVPVGHYLKPDDESSPVFDASLSSIIIVVATDAPLLPHQLDRLAKRAALGLARNGSIATNGSGDIFIAFSTANAEAGRGAADANISMLPNDSINPLFQATVEATEEAIINALVAGRDMQGDNGSLVRGIDLERLADVLRRHNRLVEPSDTP
jgi:D-aminopeptidase